MEKNKWKENILEFLHINFGHKFKKHRAKDSQLIISSVGKFSLILEIVDNIFIINFIQFDEKYQGKGIFSKFINLIKNEVEKNKLEGILVEAVITKQMADILEHFGFKHSDFNPYDRELIPKNSPLYDKQYGNYYLDKENFYEKI